MSEGSGRGNDRICVWKCSVEYGVEGEGWQTMPPQICHFSLRIIEFKDTRKTARCRKVTLISPSIP